ncbi:MAG: cell surface protein SprA, partial [Bacteroidetes bacterium]|nr:cell surface protein SprA [Bacteroidota bacterium]
SNTKQINGTANMVTLYNKIPYFKTLNTKKPEPNNKKNNVNIENDTIPPPPVNYPKVIAEGLLKAIMGVKNATVSYSEGNGTLLPGYKPSTVALGQDWNLMAPGTDFVFGGQRDIRGDAVFNGWLSTDTMLNNPYATKHTENLTARATAEPLPNFKIEVTANRNFSKNHSEYFKADANGDFKTYSPMETGSFSISYFTWNTAWVNDNKTTYSNQNFENFKAYRYDIAMRLSEANPNSAGVIDSTGFPVGYGPTSQEVLIPAFLAAYTGKNPNTMSLDIFPKIPKPNWRITYDGLSKLAFVKKYLKTLTIGHAYRSSYNVGAYVTNVLYQQDQDGFEMTRDMIGNFIPKRDINQVSITEQFSPLINFDMVWNNSLLSKFEYKKSRDLSLSLANTQLTEISSNEIIIGLGYRIKNVVINIKSINGGRKSKLKSDLTLKADVSIRTNKTVLRKVVENIDQISTGQQIISINVSGDYKLSERFNIRLFYDEIITNPFVSSQYPNSNINAGISLRFTLAQ